jgi:hypothetical protein
LNDKYGRTRQGQAGAGGDGAGSGAAALDGENRLAHALLVGRVHVLEINNATLGLSCFQLLELLKVLLVNLGGASDNGGVGSPRAHDVLHPRMIAAAAKALLWALLVIAAAIAATSAIAVARDSFLGLAGVGCGIIAGSVGIEALPQKAPRNVLHSLNLVFGSLSGRENGRQLLALVRTIQVVDGQVRGVQTGEAWEEAAIEALDEPITHADCVCLLGCKGPQRIHHALIIFDDGCCHHLAIRAWHRLANVLQSHMGLIAVPRAELLEDGGANLLESKLQYFCLDGIANCLGINVRLGEVEVHHTKRDGAVAQAWLEDNLANLRTR